MFPAISGGQSTADIGDPIPYSCMLDSSLSQCLQKTFGVPTAQTIFTACLWLKRGKTGVVSQLVSQARVATTNCLEFGAGTLDTIGVVTANTLTAQSSGLYRDPLAWDQLVWRQNGTSITIQLNGSTIATGTGSANFNVNTYIHDIASSAGGSSFFDGYIANFIFVDGQDLPASNFGRTSADTLQWVNKTYTGTYGNNGFKLEFADPTFATYGMGKDTSGRGNHWTPAGGISSANQYTDTPTCNFCVLNPLKYVTTGPSKGNLAITAGAVHPYVFGTFAIPITGKWYFEVTNTTLTSASVGLEVAIGTSAAALLGTLTSDKWGIYVTSGKNLYRDSINTVIAGTVAANAKIQIACDLANNQAWLGINDVWFNATSGTDGNPSAGTNPTFSSLPSTDLFIVVGCINNTETLNTGQRPWTRTCPTGFKALNTANLPTPAITDPTTGFVQVLATEDNIYSTLAAARSGWSDYVDILMNRAAGETRAWQFSHDASNEYAVSSTSVVYQAARAMSGSNNWIGRSIRIGAAYGTAAGSVSHTTGADTTVTHNIGKSARQMILIFPRNGTNEQYMHHADLTTGYVLQIINNAAESSAVRIKTVLTNSFAIASGVFTGVYDYLVCQEIEGFFKLGKQVGNASADGTFGNNGISPLTLWIKSSSTTDDHRIYSSLTPGYNVCGGQMFMNTNGLETTTAEVDLVSNGVKARIATAPNAAQTYVTAMWGTPSKYATAR